MTKEHEKKLIEYLSIKVSALNGTLSRIPEKNQKIDDALYIGYLEECNACETILNLIKDEKYLDRILAIWKN